MKLLSGFYQIACPSLSHPFDASAYLVDSGSDLWLIDCGTPEGYTNIISNIRRLGFDPHSIRAILGTHGHYDHVGAASLFLNDFGCRLYLQKADREQVEVGDSYKTTARPLYGRDFLPVQAEEMPEDGSSFKLRSGSLTVLHTPGHTPGSLCFHLQWQDLSILIAGDTLWGGFASFIGSDEDLWRKSLDRLCLMHFDLLTFGHMPPALQGDANNRLQEARRAFATYYNPWFKPMNETFRY